MTTITIIRDTVPVEMEVPVLEEHKLPIQACPNCGAQMLAIFGRKDAICANCGWKDSCC